MTNEEFEKSYKWIVILVALNIVPYLWVYSLDESGFGAQIVYKNVVTGESLSGILEDEQKTLTLLRPGLLLLTWVNYHVFDHMYWMTTLCIMVHLLNSILLFHYLRHSLNLSELASSAAAVWFSLVKYSIPTGYAATDFTTYAVVPLFLVYLIRGKWGISLSIASLLFKETGLLLPIYCGLTEKKYMKYSILVLGYVLFRLCTTIEYDNSNPMNPFYTIFVNSFQLFIPIWYGHGEVIPINLLQVEFPFICLSVLMSIYVLRKENWKELIIIAFSAALHYVTFRERLFYSSALVYVISFSKQCRSKYILYGVIIHSILYALLGIYERMK